jgi:hypothetical protein
MTMANSAKLVIGIAVRSRGKVADDGWRNCD